MLELTFNWNWIENKIEIELKKKKNLIKVEREFNCTI